MPGKKCGVQVDSGPFALAWMRLTVSVACPNNISQRGGTQGDGPYCRLPRRPRLSLYCRLGEGGVMR